MTLQSGISSYKKAERILDNYNLKPYDLDISVLTFKELHEQFMKYKKEDNTTEKTLRNYNFAFKRCEALHKKKVKDIMKAEIKLFLNTLKQKNGTEASKNHRFNVVFEIKKTTSRKLIALKGVYEEKSLLIYES